MGVKCIKLRIPSEWTDELGGQRTTTGRGRTTGRTDGRANEGGIKQSLGKRTFIHQAPIRILCDCPES